MENTSSGMEEIMSERDLREVMADFLNTLDVTLHIAELEQALESDDYSTARRAFIELKKSSIAFRLEWPPANQRRIVREMERQAMRLIWQRGWRTATRVLLGR